MKTYKNLMMGLALTAMLLPFAGCMPYTTGPNEVGVRTKKFTLFGEKGIEDRAYAAGETHFFVPFLTDWHTFDRTIQDIEMTMAVNRGDKRGSDHLAFKTIDGNDIQLDVTVSYQIIEAKAPMILGEVATSDLELREKIVRSIARSMPRDIFGELTSEEFYVSLDRDNKALEVTEKLNEVLEDYGIRITATLLGTYKFNDEYQQAIEDKKNAEQEAKKIESQTAATAQEYTTKVKAAAAIVASVKAAADGEYERAKIEADAYYKQQESIAKAILAEGRAEAEGIQKMNEALAGSGGEAMVKLAIAKALAGKRIIMLPMGGGGLDLRTTDINQLLELYGVRSLAGGQR